AFSTPINSSAFPSTHQVTLLPVPKPLWPGAFLNLHPSWQSESLFLFCPQIASGPQCLLPSRQTSAATSRGLRFIQVFLQSLCDGERDENHPNLIRVNATKAYEMALKKYHGWIVQKIFQAALYAAPYKSDFLKALSKGQNVTEEECLEKVRLFLVNYTATIDVIYEMYTKMNAELNYKV
uniref:Glycolipid transfer protein n=1 Tax=Ursus maritimus TaxID=29073 RepID=A0A452T381_URSMA